MSKNVGSVKRELLFSKIKSDKGITLVALIITLQEHNLKYQNLIYYFIGLTCFVRRSIRCTTTSTFKNNILSFLTYNPNSATNISRSMYKLYSKWRNNK